MIDYCLLKRKITIYVQNCNLAGLDRHQSIQYFLYEKVFPELGDSFHQSSRRAGQFAPNGRRLILEKEVGITSHQPQHLFLRPSLVVVSAAGRGGITNLGTETSEAVNEE